MKPRSRRPAPDRSSGDAGGGPGAAAAWSQASKIFPSSPRRGLVRWAEVGGLQLAAEATGRGPGGWADRRRRSRGAAGKSGRSGGWREPAASWRGGGDVGTCKTRCFSWSSSNWRSLDSRGPPVSRPCPSFRPFIRISAETGETVILSASFFPGRGNKTWGGGRERGRARRAGRSLQPGVMRNNFGWFPVKSNHRGRQLTGRRGHSQGESTALRGGGTSDWIVTRTLESLGADASLGRLVHTLYIYI